MLKRSALHSSYSNNLTAINPFDPKFPIGKGKFLVDLVDQIFATSSKLD